MKVSTGITAAVIVLLVASSASAVSLDLGPGGRLYMTYKYQGGGDIYLYSLVINADWSVGVQDFHGHFVDCQSTGTNWQVQHYSDGIGSDGLAGRPRILTYTHSLSSYATLAFTSYDRTPYPAGGGNTYPGDAGLYLITPTPGGMTGAPLGGGNISAAVARVDGGGYLMPDPSGQFTGAANNYLTCFNNLSSATISIAQYSGGTMTKLPITATSQTSIGPGSLTADLGNDSQVLGNKLYTVGRSDGIRYAARDTSGDYTGPWSNQFYTGTRFTFAKDYGGGMAAAVINGRDTVWTTAVDTTDNRYKIVEFRDANGDGAVADSEINAADVFDCQTFTPDYNGVGIDTQDIEYVKGNDGKQFLLLTTKTGGYTAIGALYAIEIFDNGELDGSRIQKIFNMDGTAGHIFAGKIAFDAVTTVSAPEPATLALVGSAVFGAAACARRRRMT